MENEILPYKELVHKMIAEGTPYEEKPEPISAALLEDYRKEFDKIRETFGDNIDAFFEKEGDLEKEDILYALNTFISWKMLQGRPITKLESAVTGLLGLEAEVYNGGFHQYFFNSASDNWKDLFDAIEYSGDTQSRQRFLDVISIFGEEGPSIDRAIRWEQLQQLEEEKGKGLWNHFDKHDTQFYDAPFPDIGRFWKFLKENRQAIHIDWLS